MGNQVQKCCRNCIKIQGDQLSSQTRFMQITGNFNKSLRCRKFFISSQPLNKQKINELLIFTDSSLTLSIPNYNLKLNDDDIQKLQEALKCQMNNNNLIIKQNCFVLSAITEQESEYAEFKEFPQNESSFQDSKQEEFNSFTSQQNNKKENKKEVSISNNVKQNKIGDKKQNQKNLTNNNSSNTKQNNQKYKQQLKKQKLINQIEQFAMRNKSRAFRFKNPLRKYAIGQIIVAIVPVFQKSQDVGVLKQAIQQGLSMSQDLKTVGVSQISFMLGYQAIVFQKIILEYILGYSRSRKEYVFKRINEFVYLTKSNQHITSFFRFLNIYTKNRLEKNQSLQTFDTDKQKQKNRGMIRRLGNNNNVVWKQSPHQQNTKITYNNNYTKSNLLKVQPVIHKSSSQKDKHQYTSTLKLNHNNDGFNGYGMSNPNLNHNSSFSSNNSFHSYGQVTNLIGFDRQKIKHIHSQQNLNSSQRSFARYDTEYPIYNNFNNNPNEISQIRSRNSQDTDVKKIRIKSFKSKQSNVSDYF